jgi:plasmid stability protein
MEDEMATLQVKGMDDQLYRALAARAAQDNRSISQQVVTIIQDYLSSPTRPARQVTEEFLALCGTWTDDRSAEEIAGEIMAKRRSGRRSGATGYVLD